MIIDELKVRLEYLNGERIKVQESFLTLNGHINEVTHQLSEIHEKIEAAKKADAERLKLEQADGQINE